MKLVYLLVTSIRQFEFEGGFGERYFVLVWMPLVCGEQGIY